MAEVCLFLESLSSSDERGSIAFEARPPVDSRLPKYMWQDIKISPKKVTYFYILLTCFVSLTPWFVSSMMLK